MSTEYVVMIIAASTMGGISQAVNGAILLAAVSWMRTIKLQFVIEYLTVTPF